MRQHRVSRAPYADGDFPSAIVNGRLPRSMPKMFANQPTSKPQCSLGRRIEAPDGRVYSSLSQRFRPAARTMEKDHTICVQFAKGLVQNMNLGSKAFRSNWGSNNLRYASPNLRYIHDNRATYLIARSYLSTILEQTRLALPFTQ